MSGLIVLALRILLLLVLYAFLGWAIWTLWLDLRRAGERATHRNIPGLRLKVRIEDREPVSHYFSKLEVTVGRDPACDVPLDDETVSTRHAKFSFHHGQWWVTDLESTNGTRLNKTPLTGSTVLTTGDDVQCGFARLEVSIGGDAIVSPTQRM